MRQLLVLAALAAMSFPLFAAELNVDERFGACVVAQDPDAVRITCPPNTRVTSDPRVAPPRPVTATITPAMPAPTLPGPATPTAREKLVATPTQAEALAEGIAKKLGDLQLDFSIPDMPAFTVLGMTPENVSQPRTSRDLAFAVKEGLDENGRLKTGLAIDFQPYRLVNPQKVLKSYVLEAAIREAGRDPARQDRRDVRQNFNSFSQALADTSISLGTAKGSETDDKSLKFGIGIRIPIIDETDGRKDIQLINCFAQVKGNWIKETDEKKADETASKQADDCRKRAPSTRWNASAWTVSVGQSWMSDDGTFKDHKPSSRGVWTTYAHGFDGQDLLGSSQFLLHLRAIDKERVPNPSEAGKFLTQDSRAAGVGFKFGSDSLNGSIQYNYQRIKQEGGSSTDKVKKLSFGIEYRASPDVWLVATVGGEGGRKNGEDRTFVLAGFRFAPSSKPLLAPE